MMSMLAEAALAVETSMAASIITKATVVIALVLVAARLARKARAAVRHLLLAIGFVTLFVLPLASLAAPSVHIVELPRITSGVTGATASTVVVEFVPRTDAGKASSSKRVVSSSPRVSILALLLTGWTAGALLFFLPVLVGLWQVRGVRRSGQPWQRGQSMLSQLREDTGVRRHVDVLLHDTVSGPVSCGALRPAIVLPFEAQAWHDDDLRRAILHELEHVRRGDWMSQGFARVVCACYWFHPMVWMAWRQLVLEAERACDDAVLLRADAASYADQLVALAERLSTAPKPPLLAMANRNDLAKRIAAVLDAGQQRGRAGKASVAVMCVASALLVASLSSLRVVVAAQESGANQTVSASLPQQIDVVTGQRLSGSFELDSARHTEIETVNLTFPATTATQGFTVEFVTRYILDRPASAPGAVEVIITQHPKDDAAHEMTMSLDGGTVPLATQRQTRRSVTTTIPVAQVQRIAEAGAITDQTFRVELRFSPEQRHILRGTADRWLKRLQQ